MEVPTAVQFIQQWVESLKNILKSPVNNSHEIKIQCVEVKKKKKERALT